MTRKQAEKVAGEIVKLARASVTDLHWTHTEFQITPELREKIDSDPGLVVGVMPMGWRLGGFRGHETLVVLRTV